MGREKKGRWGGAGEERGEEKRARGREGKQAGGRERKREGELAVAAQSQHTPFCLATSPPPQCRYSGKTGEHQADCLERVGCSIGRTSIEKATVALAASSTTPSWCSAIGVPAKLDPLRRTSESAPAQRAAPSHIRTLPFRGPCQGTRRNFPAHCVALLVQMSMLDPEHAQNAALLKTSREPRPVSEIPTGALAHPYIKSNGNTFGAWSRLLPGARTCAAGSART